jgi:predicted metal-dependent phosphoesterase TrpH
VALCHQHRLQTIAITDHDTLSGYEPARLAAQAYSITVLTGIELSAEDDRHGDVHMLGYLIDPHNPDLRAKLDHFQSGREHRAKRMVERLNELGIALQWEHVLEVAQDAVITRPHIATALYRQGYASNPAEAFERYISDGKPAYVERVKITPVEAIELIHRAGGWLVMAHPGLVREVEPLMSFLADHGLHGIEVYHPNNGKHIREAAFHFAKQHGLVSPAGRTFTPPAGTMPTRPAVTLPRPTRPKN